MSRQIDIDQNADHVGGAFKWEVEPKCRCGRLKIAIDEDKFIFVSKFVDTVNNSKETFNITYIMPVDAGGNLARSKGVEISNCPWCGDAIKCRKKYPS